MTKPMDQRVNILSLSLAIILFAGSAVAKAKPPLLQIYFIDVEGGQATLLVTAKHESVLIDTGWSGAGDADRIVLAAKDAGLKRLDYVLITHYHPDHVGGVADLLQRLPIGIFVDHGDDVETSDNAKDVYKAYDKATEHSKRIHLIPGEGLPLHGVTFEGVAAAGQHIAEPLPGAGEANSYCASEPEAKPDSSENAQSIAVLVSFGKFRFLDLGDLTQKNELEIMCPNNLIGTVNLFLTSHHGMAPDNPKALVWALHPQVVIMNNGAHKGGYPEAWQVVHNSPALEGFWQLHFAVDGGRDNNVADDFIANVEDGSDGHYIKATVETDGTFTVANSRNQVSRKYGQK